MSTFLALLSLIAVASGTIPRTVNFTMSVSPPPERGARFQITWAPSISGENVTILLNNLDPNNSSIILSNNTILSTARAPASFDSFWWPVPLDLCGHYSFSIQGVIEGSTNAMGMSQVWDSGPCDNNTLSAPTTQTMACIPRSTPYTSEPNSFLIPQGEGYDFRVGQKSLISWVPSDDDTVDLFLKRNPIYGLEDEPITVAKNIPNSGSYEWTPDSSLTDCTESLDQVRNPANLQSLHGWGVYKFLIKGSRNVLTESPWAFIFQETDHLFFRNVSSWAYPTVGGSTTILWSPHNETTITIQLIKDLKKITIADKVPNTGSWTWQVPSDFEPGDYLIKGFTGFPWDLGGSGLYSVVVGKEAISECDLSASPSSFPSPAATSHNRNATNTSAGGGDRSHENELGNMSWLGIVGTVVMRVFRTMIVL